MDTPAATESVSIPWWLVLLEGIAVVIIGLFLSTAPGITLLFLVQVIGFFWLIGGVLRLVSIFVNSSLWGMGILGALSVVFGIILLLNPVFIGIAILPFVLGAFALVGGIAAIIGAFVLRRREPSMTQAGEVSTA